MRPKVETPKEVLKMIRNSKTIIDKPKEEYVIIRDLNGFRVIEHRLICLQWQTKI